MRILFLSPRQSFPARSGARLREYHFLRALGRSAEVTCLYFIDPGCEALTTRELPFCREVVGIPKPAAYGYGKTLRGIAGKWPLPVLNYTSPPMQAALESRIGSSDFDVIHLEGIHMVRYAQWALERKPSLKAIYNWHNIDSELMRRYMGTGVSQARKWYAGLTAAKLERLENSLLQTAFGHIVCSERERAQLLRQAPGARIAVVENGVDTASLAGSSEGAETAGDIVFVGAMDYFPNSDAAIHFANRIWPEVRARLNGARLTIVGARPGPEVLALQELPGVKVTGMVPDVRPYYRGALAAVVPLRTGGGTRLKILEAMAAGVPVVSTPLGAEGLEVVDGENALLAGPDDAAAWAARLASLAESPAERARLTDAGLRLVRSRYDWEILGSKLRETYEAWMSER